MFSNATKTVIIHLVSSIAGIVPADLLQISCRTGSSLDLDSTYVVSPR